MLRTTYAKLTPWQKVQVCGLVCGAIEGCHE